MRSFTPLLALVAIISVTAGMSARQEAPSRISVEEFDRLFAEVSNWGRWGKNDRSGALNLITEEKRRQAAALVKSGISVSMQHVPLATTAPERGDPFYSSISALCHLSYKGRMFNGFRSEPNASSRCRAALGLENVNNGIFTRGVLIDMPSVKGVPWLEPRTAVTLDDVREWQERTGITLRPGDAVFLRTGRWARPIPNNVTGYTQHLLPEAGYHWSVVSWFRSQDVAVLGSDATLDVRPVAVEDDVTVFDRPVRALAIVAMGVPVLDGHDMERVAQVANKLRRWEFLVTVSPANATGTGFPVNVIATF